MHEIVAAVLCFLAIQFVLVTLIVTAKRLLLPAGKVTILVNEEKELTVPPGGKLLTALAEQNIFLSSACGGGGSCGQCRCLVEEGGGAILPTELSSIKPAEARRGMRLSCQVPVKRDLKIRIPPEMLETRKWVCRVRSNRNVATFIKELVLELPPGEEVNFQPGGFIQIEVPPHALEYKSFDIDEKFLGDWTKFKMFQYQSRVHQPVSRAYSMANYPAEQGLIKLNVRIASPPPAGAAEHPSRPGLLLYFQSQRG